MSDQNGLQTVQPAVPGPTDHGATAVLVGNLMLRVAELERLLLERAGVANMLHDRVLELEAQARGEIMEDV